MDLQYFPHFLRINYPELGKQITDEEIAEIGTMFKKHLEGIFRNKMDKLEPIWNIDAKKIIMNQVEQKPFLINGYHPALIIHFGEFVEKFKNEVEKEIENDTKEIKNDENGNK